MQIPQQLRLPRSSIFSRITSKIRGVRLTSARFILFTLLIILIGSQIFTFFNKGEIFSIKVRTVKKNTNTQAIIAKRAKQDIADSFVCKTVSVDYIKELTGNDVNQSTFYADVKVKDRISNSTCLYASDAKSTKVEDRFTATISYQEKESKEAAIKEAQKIKQKSDVKSVGNIADEAYYSTDSGQLTVRKNNQVVNVFIKLGSNLKLDPQDIAERIASRLLGNN